MKPPIINIIGCGKLGKTVGKLFKINELGSIAGILNSTKASSLDAVKFLDAGLACQTLNDLPIADIYFITTRDDAISTVATQLQKTGKLTPDATVLHCSGSLTSDALLSVKSSGASICSIHPIKSFANPLGAIETFKGTYCAIEGEQSAVSMVSDLFEKIGGVILPIAKDRKAIYHTGGVIANNYLVTLHHYATQCYVNTGIEEETAKKIVNMLMKDALGNLKTLNHKQSLTGPIQRGDANTVNNHLRALNAEQRFSPTKDIYKAMGKGTLPLTSHDLDTKKQLEDILSEEPHAMRSKL